MFILGQMVKGYGMIQYKNRPGGYRVYFYAMEVNFFWFHQYLRVGRISAALSG